MTLLQVSQRGSPAVGPVGHDAVDAHAHQLALPRLVVHRPGVQLDVPAARAGEQLGRDDDHVAQPVGRLQRRDRRCVEAEQRDEQPRLERAHRGGDLGAGAAEFAQRLAGERGHQHLALHPGAADEPAQRGDRGRRELFHLQHHAGVRQEPEHLFDGRHADASAAVRKGGAAVGRPAVAGVEALQLGEAERGDRAGAVGGAVHCRVVHHHDGAVGGHAQVHLEHVGAELRRMLERGERVLRAQRRAAAVRDHLHAGLLVAKERMAGLRAAAPGAQQQQEKRSGSDPDPHKRGQPAEAAAFFFSMIAAEYFCR